ncbi:MAG TPA: NADH-quinone oxidoreductase subunit L [Acidimicrobiales bacterium]|jgi:NADH-quinone oxidoreductase subunit L|nr:NADH-quinone oxidoreductase subunit L [Acidimicrobiales bacterium]
MVFAAPWMLAFALGGFVVLVTFGRRLGEPVAGWVATAAIAGAFVCAVVTWLGLLGRSDRTVTITLFDWLPLAGSQVKVALLVDPLSVTMCLFITGVSALIHLYSIGYMHHERDYTKFFVYLNLFVFSMLLLVLADNLLITFIGWEGVGVCSYWLVSYYFDKDSAASAGKKAFLYNRVGDVGLLVAMFALFTHLHTLTYLGIAQGAHTLSSTDVTLIVLLVLFAATGKSAQIPLFNWLPDAMEGPTPVSALIHAATMVTAGVYLLCRMNQVLVLSSTGRATIATIGAATAFIAATIATSQHDIKKVLAFSTVSQIGFMVLAVGSGAYAAAIFLMVAHAFYKGLLFLGAGSVIHGLDGEQELARMGGLRRLMAWTYGTFLVGWLTIAGVPPFSAFFAKGDVLKGAWGYSKPLWAIGVAAALLTAYYMTRLFVLAFTGDPRFLEAAGGRPALHPPHESPWVMRLPLVVLAAGAALAGLLGTPLDNFLAPVFSSSTTVPLSSSVSDALGAVDAVVAILGIGIAWALWRGRVERPELTPRFLLRVWYWDDLYDAVLGRPGTALARTSAQLIDPVVIDGAVVGTAVAVRRTARQVRQLQNGYVRSYALTIAVGLALLISYLLARTF